MRILSAFLLVLMLTATVAAQRITGADARSLPTLEVQASMQLKLVDATGNTLNATFSTPDTAVLNLSSSGEAIGLAPGTATVLARAGDLAVTEIITVVRATRSQGGGRRLASDREGRLYLSDSTSGSIYIKSDLSAAPIPLNVSPPLLSPAAITVDNRARGGLYIADTGNHSVRKLNWDGSSHTLLGDGVVGRITEPVPFERARFNSVEGLATDSGGNLYIADTGNHAVYYADMAAKTVRLLAGSPGISGHRDGTEALLHSPVAIAVDRNGAFVAVADAGNSAVRLILRDNTTTVAARFEAITDVAIDSAGSLLVTTATGAFIVRNIFTPTPEVAPLLQNQTGFTGLTYHRGRVYLLNSSTVASVEWGRPTIERLLDPTGTPLEALTQKSGETVFIIEGSNFTHGSRVSINAEPVEALTLDATHIQVRQRDPFRTLGRKLLSVNTGAGLASAVTEVRATPLEMLPSGSIATYAGADYYNGDGADARSQEVALSLIGVAADAAGNYYIADLDANRVRRVDAETGEITTFAGNGRAESSGDGGLAVKAGIYQPADIAIDSGGNVYISELAGSRVRRVDATTGIITTVAGNGQTGFSGDGGLATNASFFFGPVGGGISFDHNDNLYICDTTNQRVRRVDRNGIVTTIAGSGDRGFRGDGGSATQAALFFPLDVAVDSSGNIFISDRLNQRVRRVDATTGIITTYAGNGTTGFSGDGGPAAQAALRIITAVGIGARNQLYICDTSNNRVRSVDPASTIITTVAGSGTSGFSGDGSQATQAAMRGPTWLDTELENSFAFVDTQNVRLRRVDTTGNITTLAGSGRATTITSTDDIPAISSLLNTPRGLAFDRDGSLLIVDTGNHRIRRVTGGQIQAAIGRGQGFSGDGGVATGASFEFPTAVALDSNGNYYIADSANHRIRRVLRATGIINTVAGTGTAGFSGEDAPAATSAFNNPQGVAIDRAGNLLIADTGNHRLRRVDMVTGRVSTLAGDGRAGAAGDGGAATSASLHSPTAVAVDASGNILIADTGNNRIRRIDATTGQISTIAGADGSLLQPQGVGLDSAGNIIIADTGHHRVVVLEGSNLKTIAGSGVPGLGGDAGAAVEALLDQPTAILADSDGRLFIADTRNNRVRVVTGAVAAQPRASITAANYAQKVLTVSGSGFGESGAKVNVNGADVTSRVQSQSDTQLLLKGNRKKLNLKSGENQIVVSVNGLASNTFVLNLLEME